MPVRPPDEKEVAALAASYGMEPSAEEVAAYTPIVAAFLGSYDAVEELYAGIAPQLPEGRAGSRPAEADNPLGAWYVTTEIPGAAEGPLAGRTVAVKDNTAVAGVPMMNGSHTVEGFVPRQDATVITRLLEAGATITGKAVCEDLCFSGGSHTSVTGPVRNPWDPSRTTGGSSSGSAALVAAGEVDLALGGDQGGSIRMPAAFCGIVGHKPTHGLVPYTGAFPIELTLDHLGPMTGTVADAALVLDVLAGRDGDDPRQPADLAPEQYAAALDGDVTGLRVGVVAQGFGWEELSEPGVDDTVRAAADRLRELGIEVVDVDLPWHRHALHVWNVIATDGATVQMIEGNAYGWNYEGRYDPELVAHYGRRRREVVDRWSPTVTAVALAGRWSLEQEQTRHYAMAQNLVPEVRRRYDAALADVDLLVLPTVPMVAPEIPAPDALLETRIARALEMIVNCAPFDVSGHPATSVPAGLSQGLPVGMMLVGRRFEDTTCLKVAHAFERLVGGFPRPPAR
ncbi:amidase [Geodermatophilus sp. TF02-6]|uniref:amidase n=1 Tax=Geodermatophilus sp. TF02-6 TaxID=2250575 RepID=UPI000DEA9236|nr:amidase [Geodermatophilus sp. TF02-6]RBY77673.1 amidase [Geodermatophilus sp. TF02-6]